MSKEWTPNYKTEEYLAADSSDNSIRGFDRFDRAKELNIGSGSLVFKSDKQGIWLGSPQFATAPFRVNMAGTWFAGNSAQGYVEWTGTKLNVIGAGKLAYKSTVLAGENLALNDSVVSNDYNSLDISAAGYSTLDWGDTSTPSNARVAQVLNQYTDTISKITVTLWRNVSTIADLITISIQDDATQGLSYPTGVALASATKATNDLGTSAAQYQLSLDKSITMNAGSYYWIVFERNGTAAAAENLHTQYTTTDAYANGAFYTINTETGTNWTQDASLRDLRITLTNQRMYRGNATGTATSNFFLGFANQAIASGTTGIVTYGGVMDGFTGLVQGVGYYLSNTAGQISNSAGSNTRKVGIAISATELLIGNNW